MNHRLHLVVVVVLAVLALVVSLRSGAGPLGLAESMAVPGIYALFWLFLQMTAGEELEHVSIDERGKVSSVRSGRDVEARGDFVRVAIPAVVIAVSGLLALGLIRDIAIPPPPHCNLPSSSQPRACLSLPNLAVLLNATAALPSASPGANVSPASSAASPSAGASGSPAAASSAAGAAPAVGGFTVAETITLERVSRGLQLVIALVFLLAATWFLHRMLTGRWVLFIRPVHHRLSDE